MRFGIHTLDEFDVRGKTVLCRVDMNQPVDKATDTLKSIQRITACAPTVKELSEDLGYNLDQCGYPHEEEEILAPMDLIQHYQEERASLNAEIDRVLAEITARLGGAEL